MKSEWRTDPNGNICRIDYDTRTVEYRLPETPEIAGMKKFIVTVRGERYHVGARDAAAAANLFITMNAGGPTAEEVTVEEIDDDATE